MTEQPEASREEGVQHNPAPPAEEPAAGQYNGGPETWNLDSLPPELDYFRTSEAYQVELSGFQGPMDLLLYLINKEQVDIYDIPIARITEQFIRHIEVMQAISLDTAGEFIAMAATLMVIKMKMLMPSHRDADEEEEEDPRAELVRKLLEYKRFKEAAEALQKAEEGRRRYHLRQTRFPFTDNLDLEPRLRIEMYDLLTALAGIYDRMQAKPLHEVEREPYTVEEKMSLIEEKIGGGRVVNFLDLFEDITLKMEVIVTFIAILELVKRGRLEFMQTTAHGPLWIQRPGIRDEQDAGEPDLEYVIPDEAHQDLAGPGRPLAEDEEEADEEDWEEEDLDEEGWEDEDWEEDESPEPEDED